MKQDHIKYRLKRAKETFNDAQHLFEIESYNSSINRLYYSAFYALIALLLKNGIEVKSHNGVKKKLGEVFVLNNIIPKKLAKAYSLLSDYRHKGDYDDLFDFNKEIVENLLKPTEELINLISELVNS